MSTSFTPFEPAVRQLLVKTPDMSAMVIAVRAALSRVDHLVPR